MKNKSLIVILNHNTINDWNGNPDFNEPNHIKLFKRKNIGLSDLQALEDPQSNVNLSTEYNDPHKNRLKILAIYCIISNIY